MCNPMRETIVELRNLIMERMRSFDLHGFRSDMEENDLEFARHPAGFDHVAGVRDLNRNHETWETLLFMRDGIGIYLQYSHMHGQGAQNITLHGYPFRMVRLCIYDGARTNDLDIRIGRTHLFDRLSRQLPENGLCQVSNPGNPGFGGVIGHVLDLYIRDTGNPWNIPAGLTPDQLSTTANTFADTIAAALKGDIQAAGFYADNREAILAGRI